MPENEGGKGITDESRQNKTVETPRTPVSTTEGPNLPADVTQEVTPKVTTPTTGASGRPRREIRLPQRYGEYVCHGVSQQPIGIHENVVTSQKQQGKESYKLNQQFREELLTILAAETAQQSSVFPNDILKDKQEVDPTATDNLRLLAANLRNVLDAQQEGNYNPRHLTTSTMQPSKEREEGEKQTLIDDLDNSLTHELQLIEGLEHEVEISGNEALLNNWWDTNCTQLTLQQMPGVASETSQPSTPSTIEESTMVASPRNSLSLTETAMLIEQVGSKLYDFSFEPNSPRVSSRVANKEVFATKNALGEMLTAAPATQLDAIFHIFQTLETLQ